jgi:hypothetical protein
VSATDIECANSPEVRWSDCLHRLEAFAVRHPWSRLYIMKYFDRQIAFGGFFASCVVGDPADHSEQMREGAV